MCRARDPLVAPITTGVEGMAELPGGTVSFLLTDVEGSTALWEEAPEAMRTALARHDALFEAAVSEHGGVHIRPRGTDDGRLAVFVGAADAVAASASRRERGMRSAPSRRASHPLARAPTPRRQAPGP